MDFARHFSPPEAARGEWRLIFRYWGTNQIARKPLCTCVGCTNTIYLWQISHCENKSRSPQSPPSKHYLYSVVFLSSQQIKEVQNIIRYTVYMSCTPFSRRRKHTDTQVGGIRARSIGGFGAIAFFAGHWTDARLVKPYCAWLAGLDTAVRERSRGALHCKWKESINLLIGQPNKRPALTQISAYITHKNLTVRKIMEAMRKACAKSGTRSQHVSNYT